MKKLLTLCVLLMGLTGFANAADDSPDGEILSPPVSRMSSWTDYLLAPVRVLPEVPRRLARFAMENPAIMMAIYTTLLPMAVEAVAQQVQCVCGWNDCPVSRRVVSVDFTYSCERACRDVCNLMPKDPCGPRIGSGCGIYGNNTRELYSGL